jgi:O-glycosyl hydrolase
MGFPVKYVSPINEPQWKWGGSYVWQEGCHYETEEMVAVYHVFAEEIIKRGMNVKLYGPESGQMMGLTPEYIKAITEDETIMKVMDIFAYHSYHDDNNPNIRLEFKKEIVEKYPQFRFDMSEWCELPNKSHTKNFKGALITARIIGQDLAYAGAQSWTSWVAVNQFSIKEDGNDYSDATITATNDFSDWYVARRYWGFAHFAKYIPIDSVCLDNGFFPDENNDFNVFSFLTPDGETVTVVVNEGGEREFSIEGIFNEMKIVQSVDEDYLKEIYNGEFKNTITVKENSILTVICK